MKELEEKFIRSLIRKWDLHYYLGVIFGENLAADLIGCLPPYHSSRHESSRRPNSDLMAYLERETGADFQDFNEKEEQTALCEGCTKHDVNGKECLCLCHQPTQTENDIFYEQCNLCEKTYKRGETHGLGICHQPTQGKEECGWEHGRDCESGEKCKVFKRGEEPKEKVDTYKVNRIKDMAYKTLTYPEIDKLVTDLIVLLHKPDKK